MSDKNESWLKTLINKIDDSVFEHLSVYLFILAPIAVFGIGWLAFNYFNDLKDSIKKDCWQIKEIEGEIYKFDSCTGKLEKAKLPK